MYSAGLPEDTQLDSVASSSKNETQLRPTRSWIHMNQDACPRTPVDTPEPSPRDKSSAVPKPEVSLPDAVVETPTAPVEPLAAPVETPPARVEQSVATVETPRPELPRSPSPTVPESTVPGSPQASTSKGSGGKSPTYWKLLGYF